MNRELNLNFEELKKEDLEAVRELYDAERPMNTNRAKMKKSFSGIKNNPAYRMIVVKSDEVIVGFANIVIHHDIFEECNPFMTIWSVRVKREYRRLGVGTKLFEHIENVAKKMNCEFICLIAERENIEANEFYKKLNYSCENGYVKMIKQ